jgi:2,4-dienoyl-CoA reductase (NADPH2)
VYPNLFSPIQLADLTIPNRICMPAMSTSLAGDGGTVSDELIAYYRERAAGGCGLVTVEYACVESKFGRAHAHQICLDHPSLVEGHRRLAEAIRAEGSVANIQIHHAGRQSTFEELGYQTVAPSAVCSSVDTSQMCRALESSEIEDLIERFARSARWALDAGYQSIELHGAHGYLLHQFLSPRSNFRDDKWGGDFERRLTFPRAVCEAVKREIGSSVPLLYRISAAEFVPNGLTIDDMCAIAPHLAEAGVDCFSVSSGIRAALEYTVDPMSMEEGWRIPFARKLRDATGVPIISTGPFRHPEVAEQAIAEGNVDMVALGRAMLADPEWANKARDGRQALIRHCTSCNYCVQGGKVRCAENYRAGRELDAPIGKFGGGASAVVAGSGPGGIVSALLLDDAGFDVTLIEAREHLGGGLIQSGLPPHKDKIFWYLGYLKAELENRSIKVLTGTPAEIDTVMATNPAVVIVATGAKTQPVKGLENDGGEIGQAYELLADPAENGNWQGRHIVVYGGGETGCETAEYLAARGASVTLVSRSGADQLARSAEMLYRRQLLPRLQHNIRIATTPGTKIESIDAKGAELRMADGTKRVVAADDVFVAQGRAEGSDLMDALRAAGVRSVAVGDTVRIGRIGDAVADAYRVVRELERESLSVPV